MEQISRDDDWIVDESSLTFLSFLGEENVRRVSVQRDSNSRLWVKKTTPFHLKWTLGKEFMIMLRFRHHPRIVQVSNTFHLQAKPYEECYIYMEYASLGNLKNMIRRNSQQIPESLVQRAARMILEGLVALHSHGYVHCDLRPSNVLVFPSTTPGEPWDLKLSDFGLSKEPDSDYESLSFEYTAEYIPPECFGPNGPIMDPDLDIYALGCVVYEMFGAIPIQELFDDFYEWKLRRDISPEARDFLRRCHDIHPRRPSAAELLNHPFITGRLPSPTTEDDEEIISRSLIPSVSKLLLT